MALITPVGKSDFEWSPKDSADLVKTASVGQPSAATDKEALYEAAKRYLAAQKADEEKPEDKMEKTSDDDETDETDETEVKETEKDEAPKGDEFEKAPSATETDAGVGDVQQAVADLVEKSEKAEELAEKVGEAVGKIEETVKEVRDAIGGEAKELGEIENSLETDVTDVNEPKNELEEVEIDLDVQDAAAMPEEGLGMPTEDEIVQKSCGTAMSKADKELKLNSSAKSKDDFEKISKISPETRSKVLTYWTKYLKYEPDFCKLMVKDYEK